MVELYFSLIILYLNNVLMSWLFLPRYLYLVVLKYMIILKAWI